MDTSVNLHETIDNDMDPIGEGSTSLHQFVLDTFNSEFSRFQGITIVRNVLILFLFRRMRCQLWTH